MILRSVLEWQHAINLRHFLDFEFGIAASASSRLEMRIDRNDMEAELRFGVLDLGNACRIVINCRRVICRGDDRVAFGGGFSVLIRYAGAKGEECLRNESEQD